MKDDLCFNFPVGPICFHKSITKQDSAENKSHVMEMLFNYSGAHGGVMVNTCNSGNITAECGKYEPTLNCFIKLLCRPVGLLLVIAVTGHGILGSKTVPKYCHYNKKVRL